MASAHEHFSEQFQKWEMRGRGWQVFPQPIYPEPPFVPFHFRPMSEPPAIDDGRRPTFLSSLARKLARPTPIPQVEPEEEPEPTPLIRDSLVEFQAALPDDLDLPMESFEQFFGNLALCREPVAFELLGSYRRVLVQFAAGTDDASLVRKQLAAHFPDLQFIQREGTLENTWMASEGNEAFAVEFGLEREFMLPLATAKRDPFIGIVAALSELRPGELGLYQVLWQPVRNPWADSIVRSVSQDDGKPFFIDAPELTRAAEDKAGKPLFATVVRILVRATTRARLYEISRDLATSLRVFIHPEGNALIPLQNGDYPYIPHLEDAIYRQSRRAGMLLGGDELAGFVHLPTSEVRSPVLLRDAGLTKAAPGLVRQSPGVVIGDNEHNGEVVPVYLTADQRVRHTHIIGSSGTGKSSLLLNMIQQDIENGDGIGVLDPHGDLINQILAIIPAERIEDVVLVDPSDTEFPVGFNILSAHSEDEKSLLASDLIAVFRRLSTSWGDQMDTVLQNAILAFLNSRQGGNLSDLRRFLLDTKGIGFQKQFLQTVTDPEVVFFWREVFPQLTGNKSIGPVLTRLQDFFSRKPLRNMVGQTENKLDFTDIMDSGKIFLARLPEGCGEENSYLLGTLLVSKFQQLAMARHSQIASARRNFWLYIDEFDHFITPSMAKILSGVRKYRLGLTLAHQELHQLQTDSKVASAVMTQPCTRIVFNVGDDDAKKLGEGFASFDAKRLKNLPKFHALARVERNDCDFNLAIRKPELPDEAEAEGQREKSIAASRHKYATPRAEVEAALLAHIWGDKSAERTEKPATASPSKPPDAPGSEPSRIAKPPKAPELPKVAEPPKTPELPKISEVPKAPTEVTEATAAEKRVPGDAISKNLQIEKTGFGEDRQHEAIKDHITAEAEVLDFTVSPEQVIPEHGRIDLILTRGNKSIACEISDTTGPKDEADHIRLRLEAGFQHVAVVCINRRKLNLIREAFLNLQTGADTAKVGYYTPEEFISKLHDWAVDDPDGGVAEQKKPRRRKFDLNPNRLTDVERKQREADMLDALKKAMRRES